MGQRILHLVRHGQYRSTVPQPHEPDGPLTDLGREQAAATAQRLRHLPIQVIHHSTLQRAVETARIIAEQFPGIPLQPSDLLRECIPCVPEGFEARFRHIPQTFLDKGEPQAQAAYEQYCLQDAEQERHEIIVSSGNLISYFVCRVLDAPTASWIHTDIQNAAISEIRIGPPRGRLLARHNDAGHLPAHLQTFN